MKPSKQENRLGTNVSSKQILDTISQNNYQNSSHPRFGKDVDVSYAKGYNKGYIWVDEMCNYYFDLEKSLASEFKMHLKMKLNEIDSLEESRYKEGLRESLLNALKEF